MVIHCSSEVSIREEGISPFVKLFYRWIEMLNRVYGQVYSDVHVKPVNQHMCT